MGKSDKENNPETQVLLQQPNPRVKNLAAILAILGLAAILLSTTYPATALYNATEPIVIHPNGTVTPQGAPLTTSDGVNYYLTDDINVTSNGIGIIVNKSNIVLIGNGNRIIGQGNYPYSDKGIQIESSLTNITIREFIFENISGPGYYDVGAVFVKGNTSQIWIVNNTFLSGSVDMYSFRGIDGKISNVTIANNTFKKTHNILKSYIYAQSNLENITITNNTLVDAYIETVPYQTSENIIVEKNTLTGEGYISTALSGGSSVYIVNNTLKDMEPGGDLYIAIGPLNNQNDRVYVVNNTIINTTFYCSIKVGSNEGKVFLINNTIRDVDCGVAIQGKNVNMQNNIVENARTWGLIIGGSGISSDLGDILATLNLTGYNTINGKPILYYNGGSNIVLNSPNAHIIILLNVDGFQLKNAVFTNSYRPIIGFNVSNGLISNVTIKNTYQGIILNNASYTKLKDIRVNDIELDGIVVYDYSLNMTIDSVYINNSKAIGMRLGGGSVWTSKHYNLTVRNSTLENGYIGISFLSNLENVTLSDSTFRNFTNAATSFGFSTVYAGTTSFVRIYNNTFMESNIGIDAGAMTADEIYIYNNTFKNIRSPDGYLADPKYYYKGIGIVDLDIYAFKYATIENNTFIDSDHGIKTVGLLAGRPDSIREIENNIFRNINGTAIFATEVKDPGIIYYGLMSSTNITNNLMDGVGRGIVFEKTFVVGLINYIGRVVVYNNTINSSGTGMDFLVSDFIPVDNIEGIVFDNNRVYSKNGYALKFRNAFGLIYQGKLNITSSNLFNGSPPLVAANVTNIVVDSPRSIIWLANATNVTIRGWSLEVKANPFIYMDTGREVVIDDLALRANITTGYSTYRSIHLINVNDTIIRNLNIELFNQIGLVNLIESSNVTIYNNTITGMGNIFSTTGIDIVDSSYRRASNITIYNNTFVNITDGIEAGLIDSQIHNNVFMNVSRAITLYTGSRQTTQTNITSNYIIATSRGISVSGYDNVPLLIKDNFIYAGPGGTALSLSWRANVSVIHNLLSGARGASIYATNITFLNNTFYAINEQAYIGRSDADIDFNDTLRGNYWRDYGGADLDDDGIGDTPYLVATVDSREYYDYKPLVVETFAIPDWLRAAVEGTSYVPDISVTPTALDFGNVNLSETRRLNVTIANNGNGVLTVTGLQITGDSGPFSTTPSPPFDVLPGETVNVTVAFTPSDNVTYTATLAIESNDPDTPTVNIVLTGTGIGEPQAPLGDTEEELTEAKIEKIKKTLEGKKAGLETLTKTLPGEIELPPNATLDDVKELEIDALLQDKPATPDTSEFDVNGDGVVNILDTLETMKQYGVYRTTPPQIGKEAAQRLLETLKKLYGPELEDFPTVEGKLWLIALVKKSE